MPQAPGQRFGNPEGESEEEEELRISVYPNPNEGAFTVQLDGHNGTETELVLWNVSGKMVQSTNLTNGSNSVQLEVPSGLYLYVVRINGTPKWTGKVSVIMD